MRTRSPEFKWDPSKEQQKKQKHGVPFGEAMSVFLDPLAGAAHDVDHSRH